MGTTNIDYNVVACKQNVQLSHRINVLRVYTCSLTGHI